MKKMVHIAYSGLGGHGAVLFSLLENGFLPGVVHVVLFVGIEQPRKEYIDRCESLGIEHGFVERDPRHSYFRFVGDIVRQLLRHRPDYVFAHGLAAVPAVSLVRLLLRRQKLILRETQAHHLKSRKDWFLLALANIMFTRIVYLTPEAMAGAKRVLRWLFINKKATVIGNGLDLDIFSPGMRARRTGGGAIGMQARFQENKDHAVLVNAFSRLLSTAPHLQASLHLAGDGETMERVRALAASLGILDKVTFYGTLEQTELVEFLSRLDLYVHCTHGETMSTAIMQALASGLPTIAAGVPGVSNMIGLDNGILYRPGDVDDLTRSMLCVLQDRDLALRLSRAARAYAEQQFDTAALVEKYARCFLHED